jgi:signal transduction histidine kinase
MEATQQQERTRVELVRQALKLAPIAVISTVLNAFVLVLVLWQSISHTSLIVWFSITFCLAVQRSLFLYKYRGASLRPYQASQVSTRFVAGLGLSGIAWGFVAIFLFPVDSPTHQTLIVFVLCGMVAGAAETFSPVLPAFIAFALPTLVPLFIRFLLIGGAVYYAMSAMTLFYIVLTLIIAKRINITNRSLVEVKEYFSRAAEESAASNTRLQIRTAELSVSNRSLTEYAEKLQRLNEELQDFAFVASHDLQEPLRKIQTFCDMARTRCALDLDSTSNDYLDRVVNSAGRMRQLLKDLLQFSLAATRPETLKAIDLVKIAREAADVFEDTIKETGALIEIETMPAIEADETQILRLFQNLIGNALKFRGEEPPRIKIYAKHDAQGICEIFVKDNGIGFDPQFAERIFKPFQRLHTRGEYEGTGIGLTICRKIAERHGGSIRAESEPGMGAIFIVSLPVKQDRWEGI